PPPPPPRLPPRRSPSPLRIPSPTRSTRCPPPSSRCPSPEAVPEAEQGKAEVGSSMKARLAIVAAVGSLALAAAPQALADPIPVAPVDGASSFTARVDQITFQASTNATPQPSRMDFYVSKDNQVDTDGVLLNPIDTFHAGPVLG